MQAAGFGTTRRTGIVLSAGAIATMDIAVSVAGTTTMVDVTASAAITEPSRTDLGSTLSENMTRNLPLVSRNPYNFILFQPNVSGRANTEFGVPRKINANGFNGRINYELDGSNNTESDRVGIRLIPISDIYVAEVQQVSNGFAPEFGNTVGAVFNTITKSGANDFHGEGAYLFRRTDFSARPKLLSSTALVPEVNVDSYSVDGGGRIIKDKLFFFGAFEHVKRDLPGVVTVSAANIAALGLPASYGDPIPFRQSVYFYMGKGDWQINAKNHLSVRYCIMPTIRRTTTAPSAASTWCRNRTTSWTARTWARCSWFPSSTTTSSTNFADKWHTAVRYRTASPRPARARCLRSRASPTSAVRAGRASSTRRPRRNWPTISATSAGRIPSSSASARTPSATRRCRRLMRSTTSPPSRLTWRR